MIQNLLAIAGNNKHVSLPILAAVALEIGGIWLPAKYEPQLEKTKHALMYYGVMAASATGAPKKDDAGQAAQPQPK